MKTLKKVLAVLILLSYASEAFAADSLAGARTQIRTNSKTDVQSQISGNDGSTLLQISANNSAISGGAAAVLAGFASASSRSYTEGQIAMPWVTLAGRMVIDTSGTSLSTNIAQILGSALSATNPMFSQLTDGTSVYVGAKTGQFPTTLGQTTMSGSTSVVLASNQSSIPVTFGAPTGIAMNRAAPVSIASAGTTAIVCKSGLVISQPTKVFKVIATGAAMARCTVQFNDNAVITKFGDVLLSPSNPTAVFDCPNNACALTTSGTVTTLQYELSCNNFDSAAQDFGCAIQYCQAASGC